MSEKEFSVIITADAGEIILNAGNIKSIYFIEDIYSFCQSGKIVINDNKALLEFGPLTGNEKITIVYGNTKNIKLSFFIFKINKIAQGISANKGDENLIELIFVDDMYYNLTMLKYSKSWNNILISDIIKDVNKNLLNDYKWNQFENTKNKVDNFYMPYWTPRETLIWLIKRAINKKRQSGFCLFNNPSGMNFISMENMLSKKLMTIDSTEKNIYSFNSKKEMIYNDILSWYVMGIDNVNITNLAGISKLGYNNLKKEFLNSTITYEDMVNKYTILGEKTLFKDLSTENIKFENTAEDNVNVINNIYNNSWVKHYNIQQTISLTVKGHEDRYCSGLIKIIWPSKNENEKYNKNLSGIYLIKSITHYFSPTDNHHYKQKLVCIKNGYYNSDSQILMKAKNKRI